MIIKYIKGDLLTTTAPYIAHGCNCQGAMGAGVALAIRNKWPESYEAYCRRHKAGYQLGVVIPFRVSPEQTIFHMLTQENCGNDGRRYVSYDAIEECFRRTEQMIIDDQCARGFNDMSSALLAIPKIGAGLAGGKWNIIEPIINEATPVLPVIVYEL